MELNQYRQRRNFNRTAEPEGKESKPAAGCIFVVQKHAATRLHYDLRLELNGVMLSWAVPKGPSLNPQQRRLAVHVEDHPLDYAAFEGTIPPDQYGGGTVMIWDNGTWTPQDADPDAAYAAGHLSFRLHGRRLRGDWSLIRTPISNGSGDERKWLLIKRKDRYADDIDILQECTRSVTTDLTMEEIRDDKKPATRTSATLQKPDASRLPNAVRLPMPTQLTPQKARAASKVPEGNQWMHEIKFDGYRMLAFIDGDSVKLVTRRGNDWTRKFPTIRNAIRALGLKQAILDGEIVALTREGITDFGVLQNALRGSDRTAKLAYYLFDLPYLDGHDLTRTPLRLRKLTLNGLLKSCVTTGVIRYSEDVLNSGVAFFKFACRFALEGVVCKKVDSPYRQERTSDWLKVKCMNRQEFVIGGYTKPQGTRSGFGALLLGVYDDQNALSYCGKVGTGFNQKSLNYILGLMRKIECREPPFVNPPAGRDIQWVDPALVAEVAFREWTRDNILRQPSFKGLRDDKNPKNIHREIPLPEPAELKKRRGRNQNAAERQPTQNFRLTHPDRMLYPEQDLTKRDLANYFERIADWILPHVAGRPLMLVRCPGESGRNCFHQKHRVASMPDSIHALDFKSGNGSAKLIYISDVQGLMALVQLGTLEFHTWGSPVNDPEKSDRLIFDLDPAEDVDWPEVVTAARDLRELLKTLRLTSFVRTTGGKGLHVICPLDGSLNWQTIRLFSRAVAREIARAAPDRYVATMSKKARAGKIFIDHFRNARGATTIASYSTRARPGAPVAAPLAWTELSGSMSLKHFTIKGMPRRLAALKRDPWHEMRQIRQSLTRNALRAMGVEEK